MKIIFMGTPDFARKSLQKLYNNGHEILAVFSGADKKQGRGMKLFPSPVKDLALSLNTPVYSPEEMTEELITSFNCELIAVVAFGKLLPETILQIPPFGCVNIHGSLLPKYRGASPVQHAILNGDKITGVTSQYMVKKMDAGDVIFSKETTIRDDETSQDLFNRLGDMGAELLSETVYAIEHGNAPRIPQKHEAATFAPILTKNVSPVDFNQSAISIKNKIRALIPWPVATMELGDKVVKLYDAVITDNHSGLPTGSVIAENKFGIEVACLDGSVIITRLQAPGGKIMPAAEYLKGNKIK